MADREVGLRERFGSSEVSALVEDDGADAEDIHTGRKRGSALSRREHLELGRVVTLGAKAEAAPVKAVGARELENVRTIGCEQSVIRSTRNRVTRDRQVEVSVNVRTVTPIRCLIRLI